MNILFDFNHPVDVNFFKNTIIELNQQGHGIFITFRPRGKLKQILDYELKEFNSVSIGKHYKSFVLKLVGQLIRDFSMFKFQQKNKIDLSVCFGATNAISSWLNGIPYLSFDDDFEYKIPFYHANIFATRHIMPDYISFTNRKTWKYKGFKELSYLHPQKFTPNKNSIKKHDLVEKNYVFIREISNVSLNYQNQNNNITEIVEYLISKGKKIVISLENDDLREELEDKCLVLKEPVEDLYSLIKYAQLTISSGDTVARESCLLGTPCIYTGGREMLMNKELIDLGIMFKEDKIQTIYSTIDSLISYDLNPKLQGKIKDKIKNEWSDTTDVIIKHINDFIK